MHPDFSVVYNVSEFLHHLCSAFTVHCSFVMALLYWLPMQPRSQLKLVFKRLYHLAPCVIHLLLSVRMPRFQFNAAHDLQLSLIVSDQNSLLLLFVWKVF